MTQTESAVHQLLDYSKTHPNPKLRYHASGTILRIHSNTSYLSELKTRRRSRGHFLTVFHKLKNTRETKNAVHTVVMGLAPEAEVGTLFHNGQ